MPLAGLLSKDYAAARRELIREGRTWGEMPPAGDPWSYQNGHGTAAAAGSPPRPDYREPEADTAYVCVVDADGNTFSATPSDGIFGTPIVPGLGFAVSSRGTQTWLDPQHASRLQPWKRPRLTPNPALALRDGRSFMPFGCPGGDQQVQGMLQVFLNVVEFGLDPQAAIEAPRICSDNFPNSFWPHVYHPGRLNVETRVPAAVREQLAAWGHTVHADNAWGGVSRVCAIVVDPESGARSGGADPRAPGGHAAGW